MTLKKIIETIEAKVILNYADFENDIQWVCGADLMSDVLHYCTPNSLLITGLTQPQVIRVAEIVDIKAIVFIHGKNPERETIDLARERKIPLLVTPLSMFSACGKLYRDGMRS